MNLPVFKPYISFIMLLVMLSISLNGLTCSSCASEVPGSAKFSTETDSACSGDKHGPVCPIDEHSVPDHNDSGCTCPCHASLTACHFQISFSLQVIQLNIHDPFKALPEVYLPKFIPPHILA